MDDSPVIYRASSLGGCTKSLIASRLDYTPMPTPEKMVGIFQLGNEYETRVINRLKGEGWQIWGDENTGGKEGREGVEVVLPVTDRVNVVGHLDGLCIPPEPPRNKSILEVKSMNEEEFSKWEIYGWDSPGLVQKYKWQVSCYMISMGLPAIIMVVERDADKEDNPRSLNLLQRTITEPFYSESEIKSRVIRTEMEVQAGRLPQLCDNRIWPCPFVYLHEDDIEITNDETIDVLALEYKEATRVQSLAKERVGTIRAAIDNALGSRDKVKTATTSISKTMVKNPRLNEQKMRDKGLEPGDYKVDNPYERISVYVKKDKDKEEEDG